MFSELQSLANSLTDADWKVGRNRVEARKKLQQIKTLSSQLRKTIVEAGNKKEAPEVTP